MGARYAGAMTIAPNVMQTSKTLTRLRQCAATLAILALVQLGLGIFVATHGDGPISGVHGGVGYLATLVALVTAFVAFRWQKESGAKGVFFHALSLPVLCLAQIVLAEAGQKWVHVGLGIVYVIAVIGLFTMLRRK